MQPQQAPFRPERSAGPRVLLVDDSELERSAVRGVLQSAGMDVAGEVASIGAAVAAAGELQPDVVILEVRLPDGSGMDASHAIRAASPHSRILFLTAREDEAAIFATVVSVADGYLLKNADSNALVHGVMSVAAGLWVLSPGARQPLLEHLRWLPPTESHGATPPLSPQEQRVLALVALSKTNKEIGAAMGLSPKTIKNYLRRLFRKLNVTRRAEAVRTLKRRGSGSSDPSQ